DILTTPTEELLGEIASSDNAYAKIYCGQLKDLKPEVLVDIAIEVSNNIMVFSTDPCISEAFSESSKDASCFTWNTMESHNIFLTIPEDKIAQWRGAITLMTNQLFRHLERRPEKYSPQGVLTRPVLLLLDEFPRLGKVDIVNAVSTLRSKQVTIAIFIQSIAQLDLIYGEHGRRVIADNCVYKVFLGANDPQSQRYMSEVIGDHEVEKVTRSTSYSPKKPRTREFEIGYTISTSKQYEPYIRPDEFARLEDEVILVTPKGHSRLKKGTCNESADESKTDGWFVSAVKSVVSKVIGFFKRHFGR
ncbi:MAG: TraM recognition domain-containing protein, partial [Oscillospiraceae bacterium]|nr:TraM recognition domain-containing protein [Oscillospiraceae bacterium]